MIADVTPEGNPRTKGYTWMQTISGFFGVLAYIIGAVFGNYVLIYCGVFIVLVFSILPVFFIAENRTLAETATSESVGNGEKVKSLQSGGSFFVSTSHMHFRGSGPDHVCLYHRLHPTKISCGF